MNDMTFPTNVDMALNLIDLERYPIENLETGKGAEYLRECQEHMQEHGWCNFDGFIKPEALAAESNDLLPTAETLTIKRNIYQGKVDPSAPADDPRRKEYTHIATQLADDQIPEETLLQKTL